MPLVLSVNVLFLELGLAARSPKAVGVAMLGPLVSLALASIACADDAVTLEFLADFTGTLGVTPLFMSLVLASAFYAWAAVRHVPAAVEALTVALLALSVVAPRTYGIDTLRSAQIVPVLLAASIQTGAALYRRNSVRCFAAACLLIAAATIAGRGMWFTAWNNFVPKHLALASMLVIGAIFDDWLAKVLKHAASMAILLLGATCAMGSTWLVGDLPPAAVSAYPAGAIVAATALGCLLRNHWLYGVAVVTAAFWAAAAGGKGYSTVRRLIPGLPYLVGAFVFFLVAFWISLAKGRAMRKATPETDASPRQADRLGELP